MKTLAPFLLSLALTAVTMAASPATQAQAGLDVPTYRVGPADVLTVRVFDEPMLSGDFSVDSDGSITFPFLQRVDVRGKTLRQVEESLTAGLKGGFVNNPQVAVEIKQFRARSIYVLGEVRGPGKYNIEGPVTLLEVIAKAGSFTPNAGPTLVVMRYKDGMAAAVAAAPAQPGDKDTAELMRIDIEELKQGRFSANVLLQDSDTILIPPAERYYITGFVRTPGSFVLRPDLTVGQAIAEAGGLTERGSTRRLKILRKVNGKDVELDAKTSDPVLPGDTIKVAQRLI